MLKVLAFLHNFLAKPSAGTTVVRPPWSMA